MQLGPREREVLAAICREYILTGEAVGSRTLGRRHGIDRSAATIRNVMADLEEQGMLQKPHTSAGRVPTDGGLRFFIDQLMHTRELSEVERIEIRQRYKLSNAELSGLLREISRLLSDLSQQCALVLTPRSETARLKRLEFIPVGGARMIAVLVMSSGIVQNRLIEATSQLGGTDLERIHNYLNHLCVGRELGEVRRLVRAEMEREQDLVETWQAEALKLGSNALSRPAGDDLLIEGRARLLERPEGNDVEQMKALLRAVEQKRVVLRLLDETIDADGVRVFIGAETKEDEMRGCSVVASAYGGDHPVGTIGVIGPSNMDYPRVLPVVDFAAGILTELLKE